MSLLSTSFVSRLWVTAVAIGLAFGASLILLYRVGSVEIRPLNRPMAELPRTILRYTGEDRPLKAEIEASMNAIDSVSRTYRDPAGVAISLHVAAFTGLGQPTLPHPPSVCYPAAGGQIVADNPVTVGAKDDSITARLMTIERENVRSYVLYWYFWDDNVCTTRSQATMARLRMVGRSQWPPVVKVLLEIPTSGPSDDAEKSLTDFAAVVHEWTKSL
jgi:EpsI family protein